MANHLIGQVPLVLRSSPFTHLGKRRNKKGKAMEAVKPVQQAFGSPGGKSYLAPRIAGMIPPHETYVEPFAGGAAVYFRKEPSEQEVLSDKNKEIAFAFRFLRDMTAEQFKKLQRYDWRGSETLFKKLRNVKPQDDIGRFRRFYYLRWASYGEGLTNYNHQRDGAIKDIDKLWRVHERLKRTTVHGGDALSLIRKYDSSSTFFYLDPPYPNRAFIGADEKYTTEDLARLVDKLGKIKGKFALSLGTEHAKLLPVNWLINKVKVRRQLASGNKEEQYQYEIIATNYKPVDTKSLLKDYKPLNVGRRVKPKRRLRYRGLEKCAVGAR